MAWGLPVAGAAMGGLAGMMSPDYTGAASDYSNTMNQIAQGFQPYINQGFAAKKGMGALGLYGMLNPTGPENRMASSFQNSPYQNQIQQNTANMMNTNAAQTGMMGSTAQDAALQNQLAGQENQWQQQYIDRGTQQYNQGVHGLNQLGMMMGQQGYGASGISGQLQAQAAMAKMQAADMPSQGSNIFSDALGGAMGMMNF